MLEYLDNGYLGFTFDGRHSSEFGLLVVSDGSRYHQNFSANFNDTVITVPGRHGGYYFGTQLEMRDFEISCAFDHITSQTMNEIQQWLAPQKVGWLIFDEKPYKKYLVKISGVINYSFVPFDEYKRVHNYNFNKEILKGEFTIHFFSFEEYAYENEEYELPKIDIEEYIPQHALDSGLIPSDYEHDGIFFPNEKIDTIELNTEFSLYNAGSGVSKVNLYFTIMADDITDEKPFELYNYVNGHKYIITNPKETIKNNGYTTEISDYYIEILGKKQEVWLTGYNNNEKVTEKINIGSNYNHFYPKIYQNKPTQTIVMSQDLDEEGSPLALFHTYSYGKDSQLEPSDTIGEKDYVFEELKQHWSDYTILTKEGTYPINNIINPIHAFVHTEKDGIYNTPQNELVYLVYPNKFIANVTMYNFIADYKYTYI